jgi:hypothetical protein
LPFSKKIANFIKPFDKIETFKNYAFPFLGN